MKTLKVALVVPNYRNKRLKHAHKAPLLKKMCHEGQIDLVVYDECYSNGPLDRAFEIVGQFAEELKTPVLSGYFDIREVPGMPGKTEDGFITAAYVNPNPGQGDTKNHLYFKHASANEVACQRPGYKGREDPMYKPIQLAGHRFGVTVCHDMFFGLISARYMELGATAIINLTGGNVKLNKWRMIGQGRSIELGGAFFCTMSLMDNDQKGKAASIAYYNGCEMKPIGKHTRPDGTGGFDIYPLTDEPQPHTDLTVHQNHSPKEYRDILISFDGSSSADVVAQMQGTSLRITGDKSIGKNGDWYEFNLPVGRVGVLDFPLDRIYDATALYQHLPPKNAFRHHIAIYYANETPSDKDRVLAVARLRAIEHRIAVCVVAGDMVEVVKTNNYKYIQRMKPQGKIFGLNASNLGGTYSTYSCAIPEELFGDYLSLVKLSEIGRLI